MFGLGRGLGGGLVPGSGLVRGGLGGDFTRRPTRRFYAKALEAAWEAILRGLVRGGLGGDFTQRPCTRRWPCTQRRPCDRRRPCARRPQRGPL